VRHRARRDDNHKDIVATFRACHASVLDTASLGNGAPDLMIAYNGQTVAVEIKDGTKPPSARKLTDDEIEFQRAWKGRYEIVISVDNVIALLRDLA